MKNGKSDKSRFEAQQGGLPKATIDRLQAPVHPQTYEDYSPEDRKVIDLAAEILKNDPIAQGSIDAARVMIVALAVNDRYFDFAGGKMIIEEGGMDACSFSRRIAEGLPKDKIETVPKGTLLAPQKETLLRCPVTGITREAPKGSFKKNLLKSAGIGLGIGLISASGTGGVIVYGKHQERARQRITAIDTAPDPQAADAVRRDYNSQHPIKFNRGDVGIATGVGVFTGKETFYILGGLSAAKAGMDAWKRRRKNAGPAEANSKPGRSG